MHGAECKKGQKESNTIVIIERSLDCWAGNICYKTRVFATYILSPTNALLFSGSPGEALLHSWVGGRTQINQKGRDNMPSPRQRK